MEDYAIFEMNDISPKVLLIYEDDENFIINSVLDKDIEVMPLRLSYDLSTFSSSYIEKTKHLFSFYVNRDNSFKNELLRLKKHFKHYMRTPVVAYIPDSEEFDFIKSILDEIGIKHVNSLDKAIELLNCQKKVFFVDIDDTLRTSSGLITSNTKDVIKGTIKEGNEVVITTARPRYYALKICNEISSSDVVISSNGADIYDRKRKKVLYNSFLNNEDVYDIIDYCYLHDLRAVVTAGDVDYVTKIVRNDSQILLKRESFRKQLEDAAINTVMVIDKNTKGVDKFKEKISSCDKYTIVNEKDKTDKFKENWFAVGSADSNKGNAIVKVADYYGVPIINTIAIGNDKNDISMFLKAGISVAVKNSPLEVKKIAKIVVDSNDDEGVANIIDEITNKKV